jgi:O-antigen/teichoic acid export membrane protein
MVESKAAHVNKAWHRRLPGYLLRFGFRGIGNVAKFILTLYTARFLGLAEVGIYGLVTAATNLSPALLGFGLTEWTLRRIVTMRADEAVQAMTARMAIATAAHVVFQPVIWAASFAFGAPVPVAWIWLIAPIVWLEHLWFDLQDMLTARGHLAFVSVMQFMRAALWPLAVVALGVLYPPARTLEVILIGWLVGMLLTWIVAAGWFMRQGVPLFRWAEVTTQLGHIRASSFLYLRNITANASLYIDRYVISLTLGLELTGVYVFFWSVANVVQGMVVSVVVQPQASTLISAVATDDAVRLHHAKRRLLLEAAAWTALMSVGAFAGIVILLPFMQKPLLEDHLWLCAAIMIATWLRIAVEKYAYLLLALHRDRTILGASVAGVVVSVVLNVTLIPLFGLSGAALAFFLTGATVLVLEVALSR